MMKGPNHLVLLRWLPGLQTPASSQRRASIVA